jgi:hypothetical protein
MYGETDHMNESSFYWSKTLILETKESYLDWSKHNAALHDAPTGKPPVGTLPFLLPSILADILR